MAVKNTIKAYNANGDFIDTLGDGNFVGVRSRINNGLDFDTELARNPKDIDFDRTAKELNEYRVIRSDTFSGAEGRQVASGYVERLEVQAGRQTRVLANNLGYHNLMARTKFINSTNQINGILTGKPGALLEDIITNYRFWQSSEMDSYEQAGGTAGTFGVARWRAMQFTSGATTESALITGAWIFMKFASGTGEDLTAEIYADDGSDQPTGAALVSVTQAEYLPIADTWTPFIFDVPFQLSTSTLYHLVISSPTSSSTITYEWDIDTTATGENRNLSNDSGSSWILSTDQAHLFRVMYADEDRVRVSIGDIDTASGTSTTIRYKDQSHLEAMQQTQEVFPEFYYWRMNPDNSIDAGLWTDAGNTTHILTFGNHIDDIAAGVSIERKINAMFITDDTTSLRKSYFDDADIEANGYFWDSIHDTGLVTATADVIGPNVIARFKDRKKSTTVEVNSKNYDIFSIKPGHLVKIRNSPLDIVLPDAVPVEEITIAEETARITLDASERTVADVIRDNRKTAQKVSKQNTPSQFIT